MQTSHHRHGNERVEKDVSCGDDEQIDAFCDRSPNEILLYHL